MLVHPTRDGANAIYDCCYSISRALHKADPRTFPKLTLTEDMVSAKSSRDSKDKDIDGDGVEEAVKQPFDICVVSPEQIHLQHLSKVVMIGIDSVELVRLAQESKLVQALQAVN